MSDLMERLKAYGADTVGAMSRFLDDGDLYASCFEIFLEDACFAKLGNALAAQNYAEAFDCAHTLKGVAGNMGLTPIYHAICSLVEPLRAKTYDNLDGLYAEIMRQRQILKDI